MRRRMMFRAAMVMAVIGGLLAVAPSASAATAWTAHPLASPGAGETVYPVAVSCASASMCMTVGFYYGPSTNETELTELWNGATWSVVPTPPPAVAGNTYLESVSCPTTTACVAAGATSNPTDGSKYAFALSWDGTAWANDVLPDVPAAGLTYYDVNSIACASPTWCMATGTGRELLPFILTLSNGAWSVDTVPFPANTHRGVFTKVSCFNQSFCAAVGGFLNSAGNTLGLAEEWNGTSWRADTVPIPGNVSQLSSVSCPTAKNCIGVGLHENAANTTRNATVEHKNGTLWSSSGVPSAAGYPVSGLGDVACTSTSSCVALGYKWKGTASSATIDYAAAWNGFGWTFDTLPPDVGIGLLSCPTKTFCMGIGFRTSNPTIADSATRG